jgi:hypothetical protein
MADGNIQLQRFYETDCASGTNHHMRQVHHFTVCIPTVNRTNSKTAGLLGPATHLLVGSGHTWGSTFQSHSVACSLLLCST